MYHLRETGELAKFFYQGCMVCESVGQSYRYTSSKLVYRTVPMSTGGYTRRNKLVAGKPEIESYNISSYRHQ